MTAGTSCCAAGPGAVRRALFAALAALGGCAGGAPAEPSSAWADPATDLAWMVQRFLGSLSPEQRALAVRALADDETWQWHFVPGRYAGVELGALAPEQVAYAHGVLQTMLSATGYVKTRAIVALEDVLREIESQGGRDASHRDPGRYALLVAGEAVPGGSFVVRFQGHHVSLRVAVVDGAVVGHTPHFFGSNPHRLPPPATREPVLGDEERLARALLASFDAAQRARAVIAATAPPDVLLGPGEPPAALGERRGLPWSAMTGVQRDALWVLLELYARRFRDELADADLARIRARGLDELSFAWAGGTEPGQGHYYRIHGAFFAIEYDNTQNDANHVHTVWRDFERDFGGDPLREHLRRSHGR